VGSKHFGYDEVGILATSWTFFVVYTVLGEEEGEANKSKARAKCYERKTSRS